jgi:DNA/RNA-binding domain of Phe-tRNA-synthetase-like protein
MKGALKVQINLIWASEVATRYPELFLCFGVIYGIRLEKDNEQIRRLKKVVYEEVKAEYKIETLKDNPIVRAYRDFYWRIGIDPTKTRPSGEALLRRVLRGEELPTISTAVDAYNLASAKTIIPVSGFDRDRITMPLQVRFARNGETFLGIGMNKPITLTNRMLVLADEKQVLCIYPYRDSDHTKITERTQNVLIVGYGAPGIAEQQVSKAVETALEYIKIVCGGEIEMIKVFHSTANRK